MGDCPELFGRLFGRSANLTNAQVLDDWPTKLYHIVQYEFKNPMVARKITGMLLDEGEEYHELYKAIVRDHYRFLNPALNVDVAELCSIEEHVAEFYKLLMAVKAALLEAANGGPLNLERYVVRGASGTRLRNNNSNTLNVAPGSSAVSNQGSINQEKMFRNMLENTKSLHIDNALDVLVNDEASKSDKDEALAYLKIAATKYERLIKVGKKYHGSADQEVIYAIIRYATIMAPIMKSQGKKWETIATKFEQAIEASQTIVNPQLQIEALDQYADFLSNYPTEEPQKKRYEAYQEAFNIAKSAGETISDNTKLITALNFINVFSNYSLIFRKEYENANAAIAEVMAFIPQNNPNIIKLLPRFGMIKIRLATLKATPKEELKAKLKAELKAELQAESTAKSKAKLKAKLEAELEAKLEAELEAELKARQTMFADGYKLALKAKQSTTDSQTIHNIKTTFLRTTTDILENILKSGRETRHDEAIYIARLIKLLLDTKEELDHMDGLIKGYQVAKIVTKRG